MIKKLVQKDQNQKNGEIGEIGETLGRQHGRGKKKEVKSFC
jgi:hypothetical protein